jgi:EmrB/QacA subfamily drug resistance transporter
MLLLDTTVVNVAQVKIKDDLGASLTQIQWVLDAYILSFAVLLLSFGRLGDVFGRKKLFMLGMAIFTGASLLCGASVWIGDQLGISSVNVLIASRVLQGVGGAFMMPQSLSLLTVTFPPEKRGAALGLWGSVVAMGAILGPIIGGLIVTDFAWEWIFLINLPVGIGAGVATLLLMPDARGDTRRFDIAGYLMLSFSMVAISLSLDGLSELGLRHATVLLLMIFGMASFVAYWLHASQVAAPLFSLKLFDVPSYRVGILGNLFSRIGSGSMPFLIPLLFQVALGFSPIESGMQMVPVAIAGMISKRLILPVIREFGYRRVLVGNTLLVGFAMASFALISADEPTWLRIAQLAFFGLVNSLQFTAMNTLTLNDLEGALASGGNSLLSMVMMLSTSFGVASASGLLAAFTGVFDVRQGPAALPAFHATFVCVGLITSTSAVIFWQLDRPKRNVVKPEAATRVD